LFVFMQMSVLMHKDGLTRRAAARKVVEDNYDMIRLETGLNGTPESITRWAERLFRRHSFYTAAGPVDHSKQPPLTPAERQRRCRQRRRCHEK
jgi:hypothetical protein